jgi:hypothetical protein
LTEEVGLAEPQVPELQGAQAEVPQNTCAV